MSWTNTPRTKRSIRHSTLAISIGIVYVWFGMLKFFPELSPAEELARNTIHCLTFGLVPDNVSVLLLAIWEVGAGLLLITGLFRTIALKVMIVHILCTFVPIVCFPGLIFEHAPFIFTLLGQYIAKNIIILAALILLLKEN